MGIYLVKRLLLLVPTLLGIMLVNFIIIQSAPGGPVDQAIARLSGDDSMAIQNIGGSGGGLGGTGNMEVNNSALDSARGLDPSYIKELEKLYGFDKPPLERFLKMIGDYLTFDFGESFYQSRDVIDIVKERLPISVSLGMWSLLIAYSISIPLGIKKSVRDGTPFDFWTSAIVFIAFAVPGFVVAILLLVFFSGGEFLQIFPLQGLVSDGWDKLPLFEKIKDYLWHLVLPIVALVLGAFASLTMLTKNTFLEEINKQFVLTARAKGMSEQRVLYGHVFRNAMLIVIAGFPAAFIGVLFTSTLLIEVIFSLDGLGRMFFEAALTRDYPISFATIYVLTLIGLVMGIVTDVMYTLIDPRINFDTMEV